MTEKLSLGNATGGTVEPAIVEQAAEGPTWTTQIPVEGAPEEMTFVIGLQCRRMPVGSKFQFSIPSGTTKEGKPWAGVDSGQHTIQSPDESMGIRLTWPPGVATTMTINWWAEGKTPEPGASLEPFIAVLESALQIKLA